MRNAGHAGASGRSASGWARLGLVFWPATACGVQPGPRLGSVSMAVATSRACAARPSDAVSGTSRRRCRGLAPVQRCQIALPGVPVPETDIQRDGRHPWHRSCQNLGVSSSAGCAAIRGASITTGQPPRPGWRCPPRRQRRRRRRDGGFELRGREPLQPAPGPRLSRRARACRRSPRPPRPSPLLRGQARSRAFRRGNRRPPQSSGSAPPASPQ